MNGNRVRLAWTTLVISFILCAGLTISIPFITNAVLQRATRSLSVTVQTNQGTVGVFQSEAEATALFAGDPGINLVSEGSVLTDAADTAIIIARTPDEEELIARLQIYGSSNVSLVRATTPRFKASSVNHFLALSIDTGRVLLTIPEVVSRLLDVEITVPQGQVVIREAGQYSITTSETETQVAVIQGEARLIAGDLVLALGSDQRGIVSGSYQLEGPLSTERNLIANGDFGLGMEQWVNLAPNIELSEQPTVDIDIVIVSTEPIARFKREGIGHADAGIRQIIDQDVTDFESLRLLVSLRVLEQSLGVCGQQGSECPLTIRVEYQDVNDVDQIWQKGLFSNGEIGSDTPDVCIACPPPLNEHHRVPFRQHVFYESENLIERLEQLGILPRRIKSITVISSGHAFEVELFDVALMAKE